MGIMAIKRKLARYVILVPVSQFRVLLPLNNLTFREELTCWFQGFGWLRH